MSDQDRVIDEQAAKKVLERALELDEARRGALTAEQLRAVAQDMSISPTAIDQALEEQRLASLQPVPQTAERPRFFGRGFRVPVVVVLVVLALFAMVAVTRVVAPPPP